MHTDIMIVHCPNVGVFHFGLHVYKFSSEPIVFLALFIDTLFHLLVPESATLAGPTYPFECTYWRFDIVANAIWHALFDEVAGEF